MGGSVDSGDDLTRLNRFLWANAGIGIQKVLLATCLIKGLG